MIRMGSLDGAIGKIAQIEKLVAEVKADLRGLGKETAAPLLPTGEQHVSPSNEELQASYEKLYQEFLANHADAIRSFIKGKSKKYLKDFCRANSLSLDTTKVSKDRIASEVVQWMAQRKAITKPAV